MSRKQKLPLISVIVCCYNGAQVLGESLDAIRGQKWNGKLELIVVDDCSSDETAKIAKAFKAKVIRNKKNLGCAGSRNVGIAAAKGEIIAFADDDCRPRPTWLRELYAVYASNPEAMAVGGPVEPHNKKHWLFRYLSINNPLSQLELSVSASRKPLYRIKEYLKGIFGFAKPVNNRKRQVYSLPGANFSFRKSALLAIGGFDGDYPFSGEDQDVCRRINEQFPNSVWFAPKAKVLHAFRPQLGDTLRRARAYGKGNAHFADKYSDTSLVIFPFPLLIALIAVALTVFLTWWSALFALLLIPLFYSKWLILAIKNRSFEQLTYAYINFLQEVYGNWGLIQGIREVNHAKRIKGHSPDIGSETEATEDTDNHFGDEDILNDDKTNHRLWVTGVLFGLLIAFNLLELSTGLVQMILSSLFILVVPGYLLLRALRISLHGISAAIFAFTTSVGLLLMTSLVANLAISLFMREPHFSTQLFVGSFDALYLALLAFAFIRTPHIHITKPNWKIWLRRLLAAAILVILPLFGAFATAYLNHSGNNIMSMIVLGICGTLAICTLFLLKKLSSPIVALILYSIALTVIIMGAGRGAFLSGTDVSKEYYLFSLTQQVGHWSPSLYHDAYNACLSINLLPIMLQAITKLSDQSIFRVLIPSLYALLPVGVYALLRGRYNSNQKIAFTGSIFFIAQQVFVNWAAVPIRQMICLLFFNALLLAIFSKRSLPRAGRAILVLLFGISMILSHYSTTYMALGLLITAWLINRLLYFVDVRIKHQKVNFEAPILGAPLLVVLVAAAWIWYTPITHTSNNITHLAKNAIAQIREGNLNIFASDAHSEQSSFFDQFNLDAKPRTTDQIWSGYLQSTHDKYNGIAILPLVEQKQAIMPIHQATPIVDFNVPEKLGKAVIFSNQMLSKLSHAFIGIGLLLGVWLLWLRRRGGHEFAVYGTAAATMLVLVAVVPYASITYDLGRTSQQMLPLLVIPTITGGVTVLRVISRQRFSQQTAITLLGVGFGIMFLFATGWITQLTGGVPANKLLNNSGTQYKAATKTGELVAANWLSGNYDKTSRVYAGYYARNRLWAGGIDRPNFYNDLLPWTIDKYAYVYQDSDEIKTGFTTTYYNGSFVNYQYPTSLLSAKKNLIYSNGQTNIYK